MPTRENRRRRAAIGVWLIAMTAINLFTLARSQSLQSDFLQTCRDRATARGVIRTIMLDDPDTSQANVLRIAEDFKDISCP